MDAAKIYSSGFNENVLSEKGNIELQSSKLELNSTNVRGAPNGKKGDPAVRKRCSRPSRVGQQRGSGKEAKLDLLPDLVMDIPNPTEQKKNRQLQSLGKNGGAPFSKEDFAELEAAFAASRHPEQDELFQLGQKIGRSPKEISTWFARRRIRATKEYVKNIDMASFVPPPLPPEEPELQSAEEITSAYPQLSSSPVTNSLLLIPPPPSISSKSESSPALDNTASYIRSSHTAKSSDYGVAFSTVNPELPPLMLFLRRLNQSAYAIKKFPEKSENPPKSKQVLSVTDLVDIPKIQSVDVLGSNPGMALSSRTGSPKILTSSTPSEPAVFSLPSPVNSYRPRILLGRSSPNPVCSFRSRILPKPPPLIRSNLADTKFQTIKLEESVRRLPITPIGIKPPKLKRITENVSSNPSLWGPMMSGKPWSPPSPDYAASFTDSKELEETRKNEEDKDRRSPPAMIPIDWLYPDFRYTTAQEQFIPYRYTELPHCIPYPKLPLPPNCTLSPYVPRPFTSKYPF